LQKQIRVKDVDFQLIKNFVS